jgi:hypothetical protein
MSAATSPRSQEKFYTQRELELLTRKLENEGNFINTDQYFNRKINKMMNVAQDIQYLKSTAPTPDRRVDVDDKRTLAKLHLRRHAKEITAP